MKLSELQIQHFGCIGDNAIKVKIDNIVVLIGPNNVGKTTIVRAYEAFASSGAALGIDKFYQGNNDKPVEIVGIFNDISEDDKKQIGEKWLYEDDGEELTKYKWVWSTPNQAGEKFSWNNEDKEWVSGGMGGWDSKIKSCIPTPLKVDPFDSPDQLEKQTIELLTSAIKTNTAKDQSRLNKLTSDINQLASDIKEEISEELNKTTSKLKENLSRIFPNHDIDIEPQAGKIDLDKIVAGGTHLRVASSDGQYYPLANQGSGLQRAFLWSAIEALADSGKMKSGRTSVKDKEQKILLVEEPESFLHPPAVRAAREALYKIAELSNWQVMITTHSPIFIDVSKPHTTIVRVDKTQDTTKTFSTEKADFTDDERERLKMIHNCHPTVNEFFFADKIILVEGDTEEIVLSQFKDEATTVLNCHGKANVPMFEKILNHFGINYTVIHDLDSPKAKRKDKFVKNAAWTINEAILSEAQNKAGNMVIVNIPDFENQFFGHLRTGDKPYSAVCELQDPKNKRSQEELKSIAYGNLEVVHDRLIDKASDYGRLGAIYCKNYGIKQEGKWDFS